MVDLAHVRLYRDAILALAERHGARDVRIFGSVVRGDARSGSDIDFLVDLAPGRTLLDWSAFWQELEKLLGRPVDVATEKSLRPEYRAQALREALPLWETTGIESMTSRGRWRRSSATRCAGAKSSCGTSSFRPG